ncbi:dynein heavy chain domain-containing protein 1 [Salminus brasiliensis]|uniref:dynein heavy chain domain-containing protein 1 n=1 Tax=Salminus brasiliensis TaxID=930266 RepID=UPI003B837B05
MAAARRDGHTKERTAASAKATSLRGNSQDRSSVCSAGSVPTLPPLTPAFLGEPPPGRALSRPRLSQPADLSVLELPQLVAKVGPEVAVGESIWMEGPCLMASALGADIPLTAVKHPQQVKSSSTDQDAPVKKHLEPDETKTETKSKTKRSPLTGFEVFEVFAKKRHLGELQFYHLKAAEDGPYRPYDLQVVPRKKAGSDHYIFSPTSVMHVQDGCSVGLLTLAGWYREAVLWKALRDIPFFRDYLLRKTFMRWRSNICRIVFQRKHKLLESQLLIAVPQFREALFHFTRLLEELKKVHWLPQDETRTYTFLEFQTTLLKNKEESQGFLERFLQYRSLILAMVQETSYRAHQELQHQVEQFQLRQCSQPMHLQQVFIGNLSKELNQAEQDLQRLGNIAALMDYMIVQSLATVTRHETINFLNKVLKREQEQQGSLFQAELIFGEDGRLTVFPPVHLFQQVLLEALLSVGDSALQVFDSFSNSPDTTDTLAASFSLTSIEEHSSSNGLPCDMSRPVSRASKDRGTSADSLSSMKEPCVPSTTNLVLPRLPSLRVEGQRVRGQYYPLCSKQLEWHLQVHAGTEEVEREQARITQEALQEIQQLCERHSWLSDARLFTNQWSTASLKNMQGWPAPKYKEHIQKVHYWRDRVCAMPPAFTTSSKLLTVTCSRIQEKLESLLTSVGQDAFKALSDELQLRSANLTSELKQAVDRLKPEPTDLSDFTHYASTVKHYKERTADMKQQLDCLYSLRKINQLNHGDVTPGEQPLTGQTLWNLWNQFVLLLKQATDTVTHRLPLMINILDSTFSSLTATLEDLVSDATTGSYIDPKQSAGQMVAELRLKCRQLNVTVAQLDELIQANQSLRGLPLNLISVKTAKQSIEARKELWELVGASTAQIEEWRLLLFGKFVVSRAQEKVTGWLQQAVSLSRVIPAQDAVLQVAMCNLEELSQQLAILAKLSSPTLKYKHWRNICKGMGLFCSTAQNLTVSDLVSKELLKHEKEISKIYREAKAAEEMEQTFRKIQQSWEGMVFRLSKFIVTMWQKENPQLGETRQKKRFNDVVSTQNAPQLHACDSGTFTIMDLGTLLAQTEDSIMTLSSMLLSPYVAEFRKEAEHWVQLLQDLGELLDFCERYQQKWVFLSKIFSETSVSTQKVELLERFSPVDKTFREMIQVTLTDPHVLNFVRLRKTTTTCSQFQGQSLCAIFTEGITAMDKMSMELLHLVDSAREEFPRLCFLNDREVMKLCSLHQTPSSLLPLVRKCFRGVQWLQLTNNGENDLTDVSELDPSSTEIWVRGVYGTLRDHLPFLCPLEPNLSPLSWLGLLENKLYQTMEQLMLKCTLAQHCPEPEQNDQAGGSPSPDHACISSMLGMDMQAPSKVTKPPAFLQLTAEYPLQCCLVAEEVLWCSEIEKAFRDPAHIQTNWVSLKSRNAAKLKSLCQAIQDKLANSCDLSLASRHTVTALQALILLTMKHSQQLDGLVKVQGSLESSFEWQRLMKYRLSATDNWNQCSENSLENPNCTEHSVYVSILGTQLAYGYEYIGPENWTMVITPSTERAFLGLLLALTSYRCAYISGPVMSGKEQTVLQLGWALGRQVITLKCCVDTSLPVVCQMLKGALQTGAWLVLDSVDSMEQGTLSVLGQHLSDLHQYLSTVQGNAHQKAEELQDRKGKVVLESKHCQMEFQVPFGERNILAKLSFGCVLISSHGYSAEVPENVRVATRPVSLMQPDYSIIAEVLLVSSGFSEATSMSRRLVSLFNLAKDSFCLPDYVCRDQSSWLVLMRKIIYVSGTFLHKKPRKVDKDRFLSWDAQRPDDPTLKGSDKVAQESKDPQSSLDQRSSKSSIVNAIREEQSVIKGVMLVLLPAIVEHKRASQFRTIFEETFPTAGSFLILQHLIEPEAEQNLLRNAVTEELQETGFCADTQILHSALTLHQTLEFSKAVVMLGPAGSGKTTSYRALAGALRRLAAKSELEKNLADIKVSPTSRWCSVNTVVLFPNALSHEELFGGCYKQPGCWCGGAFTKAIRNTGEHDSVVNDLSYPKRKVKWLVLDGEPSSQPGWFDSLNTLGDPRDPCLCLSSGEKIQTSQDLKIIIETTSLRDATPSALAQCNLVYVSGQDLWKAVWKSEMDALYRDHILDQSTLKMWSCLADDLFSRSLIFLKHNALSTVPSSDGHEASTSDSGITDGLREVTSFVKILHALLGASGKGRGLQPASKLTERGELQARNVFVIAYIWGFGGQLHPRHWLKFDLLAREALFESRYKIEVPAEGIVFEHFFNFSDGKLEAGSTSTNSFVRCPQQYEKHAYLLDLMLEAHQPALLVGEAGSGKTVLCQSLSQQRPHVNLKAGPLLRSADLRNILKSMGGHKTRLSSGGTIMQHPGLLLFVDDLHDAPFDSTGKISMPLETLRQCISRGGALTSDGCHFKLFSSGAMNYLGACSTLGTDKRNYSQISPRFSRLFTVLVLPSMTAEALFSIHSTQLQQWLKSFPSMPRISDMARCIVTATFDVYLAVREHLCSSAQSPLIVFSLHDLQKVFQGMSLWDPRKTAGNLLQRKPSFCFQTGSSCDFPVFAPATLGPAANVLNIARLWMHECLRTFGDRLSSNEEIQKLVSVLSRVSEDNYGRRLMIESQSSGADKSDFACQLKETNRVNPNQQHSTPIQQEMDEGNAEESSTDDVTEGHSESSEEKSSSNSSFSRSESDEGDYSIASSGRGIRHELNYHNIAHFQPESAPRTANYLFQSPVSSEETEPFETSEGNQCLPLQLLLEMGSSACNMVYSPDLGQSRDCVAQQHNYRERDLEMLVQQLAHIVKQKEEDNDCKSTSFAVYRKRVCQLVHILRSLLIPGGHGVLFAAGRKTGRKTAVRLAAYLTGYKLIEVHRGNESKLKEILKEAESQSDVNGRHVVFLVHEDISQTVRDKLMAVMANGIGPELSSDKEMKDVMPNIIAIMKGSSKRRKDNHVPKRYFRNNQRNLHMFWLLSFNQSMYEKQTEQSGQLSLIVRSITKVVSLCSYVEVYHPWSSETFIEIATDHLKQSFQISATDIQADEALVGSIAKAMAGIHQSALQYASMFLTVQPFGPQTFFELMTHFYQLCGHLREQGRGPANRVATALARLKDMTDTAHKYRQELFRLQAEFDDVQKWLNQLQKAVDTEHTSCEQARQHCLLEEDLLSHLEEQLELVEQQAKDALNEVGPLYQAALKALKSLNQSDLDEVRHYRHPPDGVVMLMNAICMLFNRACNWESSKQLLGQTHFLQDLEFFDRSKLSNESFQKLGEIVQAPNFQPDFVRDKSQACESLSCWLQAVYQYACVQRHMAPQYAKKNHLCERMSKSRARLRVARLQEEAARDKLENMERQQMLVKNSLEELAGQLHKVEAQEKKAAGAVKQVLYYTEKWRSLEKETKVNKQTISGDALILAAAIAYLGPFGPDNRLDLLEKWHKMCLAGRMSIGPEHPQKPLHVSVENLSFVPIPVGMELHRVLARAVGMDDCFLQVAPPHLVLKLLQWGHRVPWAHHWALLANTQQYEDVADQLPEDVERSHKEDDYELVVSADDPEFLDKLSRGEAKGLRVLITDVEHAVPSEDFLSMLVRPAGRHSFGSSSPGKAPHSEYCLFLSTSLPVRVLLDEIHPLILERVNVLDLSLSTSEVQDIILTNVLQSEYSDMWVQHCRLKRDQQVLQDKLCVEEASLMEYIMQSFTPLLQDPEFLPRVSVCQSTSLKLKEEIKEISNSIDCHKPLLNACHGIAALATNVYKALQDVGHLSPFYFFPLHKFLCVLREALALKGQPDVTRSGEITEISHRMVSHILAQYRPCLLQSHAEVLKLLVSVAFFMHAEDCSETERITFLQGISAIQFPEYAPPSDQTEPELPSWIPLHIQANVRLLEKIPSFHGLVTSLRASSRQWQQYLHFPSSTVVGSVPCETHSHLTTLQRAILWRTFFPQCLAAVADDLAVCQQVQPECSAEAGGPHTGSLGALSHFLSRNKGPVVVTLPGQSKEESGSIHPLYWINQLAKYQEDEKGVKVKVISFGSESQRDAVLSELDRAVQTGHWLVLNNCHLLDHWDVKIVTRLRQLMFYKSEGHLAGMVTDTGTGPSERCARHHVHAHFRLWFITKGNAPLSVPAVVRVCALHLVSDSNWDLRDGLCSSLRQVLSKTLPATSSRHSVTTVEPLIRCAILHSVLLQRRQLKHIYNWTQEDLLDLVDAQDRTAKHCYDPTRALEYIAAYLTYGGHVSNSSDLEAVKAVCRVCLRPSPPTWGSGPHTLSEMIMAGYFDEENLVKALERRVQTTLNSNDSVVLGFSAGMTSEMVKVKSHRLNMLLLQSQGGFAAVRGGGVFNHFQKLPGYKKARERLQALWDKLRCREDCRSISVGTVPLSPLCRFLQTEMEYLMELVVSLLENTSQPSQYPSASSYVTSSSISKLETRADLLRRCQWEESSGLGRVYCLSAFANPRGFLAALVRENAKIKQQDVSNVSLHFQVLGPKVSPASIPTSGICISGLELHSALWDTRLGVLQDTLSSKPCLLPLIWVRAQERNTDRPPSSTCSVPLYNCPLYLDSEDTDEDWSLTEENIITHVPLMTRLDPVLCTLRKVRLVSTLKANRFDSYL